MPRYARSKGSISQAEFSGVATVIASISRAFSPLFVFRFITWSVVPGWFEDAPLALTAKIGPFGGQNSEFAPTLDHAPDRVAAESVIARLRRWVYSLL